MRNVKTDKVQDSRIFGIKASTASENGTLSTHYMGSHSLGCPEPRPRAVLTTLLPPIAISNMKQN